MFTYGDGICDVNLNKLVKFHQKSKKLITVTAVRPPARFGEIKISGSSVNGGFFVSKTLRKNLRHKLAAFKKCMDKEISKF